MINQIIGKLAELDADELKPVPTDLSKLSDVVKSDVVKNDRYNSKIKDIEDEIPDITNLATNIAVSAKINEVKSEIPTIINLATNTALNAKINEVKNEIPSVTNLATTDALTAVENKNPNVSDLVKRADYDTKISEMKIKYFTTSDYNKFTNNILDAKITEKKIS